jgi:UDP-N-acetylglucosamine 2-epimerase (non-hydrolysing)
MADTTWGAVRVASHQFVVLGTRPEAIKLMPVIAALRARKDLRVTVCATAQHRDILDQVLEVAGIAPDLDFDLMQPDQSLDELASRLMARLGPAMREARPDRVIVQGDTTTAAMAALCAHYHRLPVAHVEAGLRSGDPYQPWPEEVNRKVVTQTADLHFAPTRIAADNLLAEGIDPASIHLTGNTVIDALMATIGRIDALAHRTQRSRRLIAGAEGRRILLVTCHRRENFGAGLEGVVEALGVLARRDDVEIIVPVHPNPAVRKAMAPLENLARVRLTDPLDYVPFVHLLSACHLVLTDSGGVQEEAPALGKPVLVLRDKTERPEGVEAGCARLVGARADAVVGETLRLHDDPGAYAAMTHGGSPYGDGRAAERIADVLEAEARGQPLAASAARAVLTPIDGGQAGDSEERARL